MTDVKKKCPGFLTVDDAINMNRDETIKTQKEYQNHVRVEGAIQLGAAQYFTHANENGCELFDQNGNSHLDMIGGVGVMTVGNSNQFVWEQMVKVKDQPAINALALRALSASLASNIAKLSPGKLKKVWFGTAGAEAIEAAIKLVKMSFKGVRHKMVSCIGAYHGKTTGALSLTGREKWALYQSPLMPAVKHVPFNDIDALEDALHFGDVAAFFVEPVQGEGGVHPATIEYLQKVRELCTKYGTLMVTDEIQCGLGRTGKMWAFEHAGIVPDVVTFAKGFSGSYMPIGGYICTEEVWNKAYGEPETAFHHTVTFGNNVLSCAAGIATLQFIIENDLINAATEKGEYLMGKLKVIQAKYPQLIKEIRGKGLMIGMQFNESAGGAVAATMMNKYRVQTMFSMNNPGVIRALPPLAVTYEQLDRFLDAFENSVKDVTEQIAQAAATKA